MRPPTESLITVVRERFPEVAPEALTPLGGGLSGTPLYTFEAGGRRYVARHVDGERPFDDARRQFACMTLAAERGVAPAVVVADPERGVCVTDFVPASPDRSWLRTPEGLARLARLIRRLHDGPPFDAFVAVPHTADTLVDRLVAAGAAAPELLDVHAASADITSALARHATPAPCHYDLNPGNILFDGDRLWLVDWEMAGAGDPFHDLGTLCIFGLPTTAQREALLSAYLDRPPRADERARLHLARLQALVFYAAVFQHIALGSGSRPTPPAAATPRLGAYLATLRPTPGAPPPVPDPHVMSRVLAHEIALAWRAPETAEALATL